MDGQPAGGGTAGAGWLGPSAAGVLALTADAPDPAVLLADGPLLAHFVRGMCPPLAPADDPFASHRLLDPTLLAGVAHAFANPHMRYVLTPVPLPHGLDGGAARAVALAAAVAPEYGVPANLAAVVTRLAFLGHDAAARFGRRRYDAPAVAARLAVRWRFPDWLVTFLSTIRLPAADAIALGAPAALTRVVRATLAAADADAGAGPLHLRLVPSSADAETETARALFATTNPDPLLLADPGIDRQRLAHLLRATAALRESARRAVTSAVWAERLAGHLAEVRTDYAAHLHAAKLGSLAEFAAGASHEINNPLAVIRGNAQLLLAKEPDPAKRATLSTMIRQTTRIHDILQGTRQFARPPAPRRGAVDVAAVVGTVLDNHQLDAARKNVALELGPPAGPVLAAADAGQVTQALSHVVRNAVDAAPPGGWVRVTVHPAADTITMTVADSGPGPTADQVAHLFDPFYSGREAGRGRGLGLSIAWRLARQNGGDVRFAPAADGVTRFAVTLPRLSEQPARRSA